MNISSKRVLLMAIPGLIECLVYFIVRAKNLEMFFFIWIFVFALLLIYNIFFTGANNDPPKGMGCAFTVSSSTDDSKNHIFEVSKTKNRVLGGIKDPINIVYLLYSVGNIIGYIVVMPA